MSFSENVRDIIIRDYLKWSKDLPFATITRGNKQTQFPSLTFNFEILANETPTEPQAIQDFANKFLTKIQNEEALNFVKNICTPISENQFSTTMNNLSEIVNEGWLRFHTLIGKPNVIIWPRNLCVTYMQQTKQGYPPKINNEEMTNVMLDDPSIKEIFLLHSRKFGKIYPANDSDRLVIQVNQDTNVITNTRVSGYISHKVVYAKPDELVSISVN